MCREEVVHEEEVDSDLECPICDFKSSWKNGLRVHMSRKHKTIIQIDGCADDEETDAKYANTEHYWMKSWLGISYHVYLDAKMIIDTCDDLSHEEKEKEKARLLEVRRRHLEATFLTFRLVVAANFASRTSPVFQHKYCIKLYH